MTFDNFTCPECGADRMSQQDFRIHLVQKHPTTWLAKKAREEIARSLDNRST